MTSSSEVPAANSSATGGKASLLVVFLTVFIDLLGFGIVLPLLPIYSEEFAAQYHLTDVQIGAITGLLMASFSAMQFLFMPIWGRLSDRVGRRPILIMGLVGSTVFYAMFGVATMYRSLIGLFLARIGAGISGATISTAQAYIADVTTKQTRAKGMALIGAAFAGGFLLGPLMGIVALRAQPAPQASALPSANNSARSVAETDPQKPSDLPPGVNTSMTDVVQSPASSNESLPRAPLDTDTSFSPMPGFLASAMSGIALLIAIFKLKESWRPGAEHAERKLLDRNALREALATPSVGLLLATTFISIYSFGCFESTLGLQIEHMVEVRTTTQAKAEGAQPPKVGRRAELAASQPGVQSPLLDRIIAKVYGWGYRGKLLVLVVVFVIFGYLGVVLTLAQGFLVRRLAGRLSEGAMALIGGAAASLGFLLLAWATTIGSFELFIAGMTVEVVGFAFVNPSLQSLLSRRSNPAKQGSVAGLSQSASSLARIAGPATGPALLKFSPAWPALPYFLALALMVVGTYLVTLAAKSGSDYPQS